MLVIQANNKLYLYYKYCTIKEIKNKEQKQKIFLGFSMHLWI